jgi:flagellar P-ring protein precursor FlgI
VKALNAAGVSTRDVITILQTIKASGALHAELEVI